MTTADYGGGGDGMQWWCDEDDSASKKANESRSWFGGLTSRGEWESTWSFLFSFYLTTNETAKKKRVLSIHTTTAKGMPLKKETKKYCFFLHHIIIIILFLHTFNFSHLLTSQLKSQEDRRRHTVIEYYEDNMVFISFVIVSR